VLIQDRVVRVSLLVLDEPDNSPIAYTF